MKALIFTLVFGLGCSIITAQNHHDFVETSSATKSLQIAQRLISMREFEMARKQLEHTIKIKEDFAVAYRELGVVLLELNYLPESIEAYEKSFELDNKLSRAAFFECGEAYFRMNKPTEAEAYYLKFKDYDEKKYANKEKESGLEYTYGQFLEERLQNCAFIANIDSTQILPTPINLGPKINSDLDEYLPTITSDGIQLVYTRQIRKHNEDVMISNWQDSTWQEARKFGRAINTKSSEGMAKFETHGRSFYFSGCMRSDTEGGCDIYQAILEDGDVSEVKRVDGFLNSEFWDSQPAITCDGRYMYFSSSREGGYGGADIYVSVLDNRGYWGAPKNLGPAINTDGDEEAPFISTDGYTLYFSSNGHPGQGEGDLYISRKTGGDWSMPENLGYPINTPAKELGFYVQGDGKTAYMASSRGGGHGGLDIYKFELPEGMRPDPMVHFEGYVKDEETGEGISTNVIISREDEMWVMKSDDNGWFFTCLPSNKAYSFQIHHNGYVPYLNSFHLASQDNVVPHQEQIFLLSIPKPPVKKEKVVIRQKQVQFFFDFDSYALTTTAKRELAGLAGYLHKNPDWKVEVVGYADSKGNAEYNKILSKNRAASIVGYLEKEGINIDNVIRNEGRGSVKDKNENDMQYRRVDVILTR